MHRGVLVALIVCYDVVLMVEPVSAAIFQLRASSPAGDIIAWNAVHA